MNQIYYLNNSGSRWVYRDDNNKNIRVSFQTTSGKTVYRAVKYYESFGNFTVCSIHWKGERIKVFPETILDD